MTNDRSHHCTKSVLFLFNKRTVTKDTLSDKSSAREEKNNDITTVGNTGVYR